MSPFDEKCWPSSGEHTRPELLDRSRISVEPNVSCGENHLVREQLERRALPGAQLRVGMHDFERPGCRVLAAQHAQDGRARDEPRAAPLRDVEQVRVERILRAVVAAGRAVAAAIAGSFELRSLPFEERRERRRPEARFALSAARELFEHFHFCRARAAVLRDDIVAVCAASAEQLLGLVIPAPALVGIAKRPRPPLVEDSIGRRRHDARVDQRAAAQTVRDQGVNVAAEAQVEQTRASAPGLRGGRRAEAHVTRQLGRARRKHAGQILGAALEHADLDRVAVPQRAAGRARRPRLRRHNRCRR